MFVPRESPVAPPDDYLVRRAAIASMATGVAATPVAVRYRTHEHQTWRSIHDALAPVWDSHAAQALHLARQQLALPTDHIPQLNEVTERLASLTGFRYVSVAGTVPGATFFGALGNRLFPSTQFIRWSGSIGYTEAPDVVHEIGGHSISLADPLLADLHYLAGQASLAAPDRLADIAAVFWYSIEFGVVREAGAWKAYGTGLLSSPGELAWFADNAEVRAVNIADMIATPYDISTYQPIIFGASSLIEVHEIVGGYYRSLIEAAGSVDREQPASTKGVSLVSP